MKKIATAAALGVAMASATLGPPGVIPTRPGLLVRGGTGNNTTSSVPSHNNDNKDAHSKRRKKKHKTSGQESKSERTSSKTHAPEVKVEKETEKVDPVLEELIKKDDYYAILGVSKTATGAQIKKAYRKRAVLTHPDKTGGDRRAFDKVSEAYGVLSDDSKRPLYDRFGKRGLEGGVGGMGQPGRSSSAEDLFRQFFGQTAPARRNRTVRYQLEVSLEDLYRGQSRPILVEQPGGRKKVQVHIPKGTASGESIVLSGEMDGAQDSIPADLIFLLQQRPHPVFTRKGHDLAMELRISLQEALCGVEREITHLDGRKLVIQSAKDAAEDEAAALWIQSGDVQVLEGEGMPKRDEVSEFGDLYIRFLVEMPTAESAQRLSVEEREQLGALLSKLDGRTRPQASASSVVRVMSRAKPSDIGQKSGPFRAQEEAPPPRQSSSSYYWSGGFGGPSSPFFGGSPPSEDDGSNVQCQQM